MYISFKFKRSVFYLSSQLSMKNISWVYWGVQLPRSLGCHGNHLPPIWKMKILIKDSLINLDNTCKKPFSYLEERSQKSTKVAWVVYILLSSFVYDPTILWPAIFAKSSLQYLCSKAIINSEFHLTVLLENRKGVVISWNLSLFSFKHVMEIV